MRMSYWSNFFVFYLILFFSQIVLIMSNLFKNFPEDSYIDFSLQPQSTVVVPSNSLLLNCEITRYSILTAKNNTTLSANVTWFKNGLPIDATSRTLLYENGSLYFPTVIHESDLTTDGGEYECYASYYQIVLKSRKAKVKIAVFTSSSAVTKPVSKCLFNSVHLHCNFENPNPEPIVTWYKDGVLIGSSVDYIQEISSKNNLWSSSNSFVVLPNGTLEITNASSSNAGEYRCEGNLDSRRKQGSNYALTISSDCPESRNVHFSTHPSPITVIAGKTAVFLCSIAQNIDGSFKWFKNGEEIVISGRYRLFGLANLLIDQARLSDGATYKCLFKSKSQTLTSSARLTVLEPPRVLSPVNHLRKVEYGCQVLLSCGFSGVPYPSIRWYKDGKAIKESVNVQLQPNKLLLKQISNVNDCGIYQCFAENEVDQTNIAYQLLCIAKDIGTNRPTSAWNGTISIDVLTPSYADISWPSFRYFDPIGYKISVHDNTNNSVSYFESKLPRFKIKNLKANHSVRVSVSPLSTLCNGPSSDQITFEVPPFTPGSNTVQSLSLSPTETTIMVKWSPPANLEESKLQYHVTMEEMFGIDHYVKTITTSKTYHEFSKLRAYTEYAFQVAAVDPYGRIQFDSEQIRTMTSESVPEQPPSVVSIVSKGEDVVVVSWNPPPVNTVKGPIVGYRIKYKELDNGHANIEVAGPDSRQMKLTDLRRNTRYWLRMQVFNNEAESPFSKRMFFDTSKPTLQLKEFSPPGLPQIQHTNPLAREIILMWSPPDDGVHVSGYVIGWGELGPYEHTANVHSDKTFYRITGLEPSTLYFVSIRAKNAAGMGQEYHKDLRTADLEATQEELFPPVGLHVKVLTDTILNVSWHDEEREQGDRHYIVRYKTNVPELPKIGYVNATDVTCFIRGLRPHTVYEIAVRVIKGKKKSIWSMTTTAITDESEPTSPPTDLTVMPIENNPTSVQLNWQPPVEPNGELNGYMILYSTNPSEQISGWVTEPVIGGKLSTTITGLTKDTQYYFKAQARNSRGMSPYSDVVQYRTPNVKTEEVEQVFTSQKQMADWMWYVIIGSASLLVLSIVIISTILICRNRRARNAKRNSAKGPYHRPSANGIRSTSGDSFPYSVNSAQSAASIKLMRPEERQLIEMKPICTGNSRYASDFHRNYQTSATPAELTPFTGSSFVGNYPYASHSNHHNDVVMSPVSSTICKCCTSQGHYGNDKALQLSNLHRSTCEIAQYDVDCHYPYNAVPVATQDYAVDSAYASDHQHHHAVDDQLKSRPLKYISTRKHKSSYNDSQLPSDRSSPLSDSIQSTHGSSSLSDESVNLANVKDFLRTMRPDEEIDTSAQ